MTQGKLHVVLPCQYLLNREISSDIAGLGIYPHPIHNCTHLASSVAAKKNKQTMAITLRGLEECVLTDGAIPKESQGI